jgi:hypothetical protein
METALLPPYLRGGKGNRTEALWSSAISTGVNAIGAMAETGGRILEERRTARDEERNRIALINQKMRIDNRSSIGNEALKLRAPSDIATMHAERADGYDDFIAQHGYRFIEEPGITRGRISNAEPAYGPASTISDGLKSSGGPRKSVDADMVPISSGFGIQSLFGETEPFESAMLPIAAGRMRSDMLFQREFDGKSEYDDTSLRPWNYGKNGEFEIARQALKKESLEKLTKSISDELVRDFEFTAELKEAATQRSARANANGQPLPPDLRTPGEFFELDAKWFYGAAALPETVLEKGEFAGFFPETQPIVQEVQMQMHQQIEASKLAAGANGRRMEFGTRMQRAIQEEVDDNTWTTDPVSGMPITLGMQKQRDEGFSTGVKAIGNAFAYTGGALQGVFVATERERGFAEDPKAYLKPQYVGDGPSISPGVLKWLANKISEPIFDTPAYVEGFKTGYKTQAVIEKLVTSTPANLHDIVVTDLAMRGYIDPERVQLRSPLLASFNGNFSDERRNEVVAELGKGAGVAIASVYGARLFARAGVVAWGAQSASRGALIAAAETVVNYAPIAYIAGTRISKLDFDNPEATSDAVSIAAGVLVGTLVEGKILGKITGAQKGESAHRKWILDQTSKKTYSWDKPWYKQPFESTEAPYWPARSPTSIVRVQRGPIDGPFMSTESGGPGLTAVTNANMPSSGRLLPAGSQPRGLLPAGPQPRGLLPENANSAQAGPEAMGSFAAPTKPGSMGSARGSASSPRIDTGRTTTRTAERSNVLDDAGIRNHFENALVLSNRNIVRSDNNVVSTIKPAATSSPPGPATQPVGMGTKTVPLLPEGSPMILSTLTENIQLGMQIDKLSQLKRSPLDHGEIILDSNIVRAFEELRLGENPNYVLETSLPIVNDVLKHSSGGKFRVPDIVSLETTTRTSHNGHMSPENFGNTRGLLATVGRDSEEYQAVLVALNQTKNGMAPVGNDSGPIGLHDRVLVADILFAATTGPDVIPTLATNDIGIINPLLKHKIGGKEVNALMQSHSLGKRFAFDVYKDGFDVEITGRKIKILPIGNIAANNSNGTIHLGGGGSDVAVDYKDEDTLVKPRADKDPEMDIETAAWNDPTKEIGPEAAAGRNERSFDSFYRGIEWSPRLKATTWIDGKNLEFESTPFATGGFKAAYNVKGKPDVVALKLMTRKQLEQAGKHDLIENIDYYRTEANKRADLLNEMLVEKGMAPKHKHVSFTTARNRLLMHEVAVGQKMEAMGIGGVLPTNLAKLPSGEVVMIQKRVGRNLDSSHNFKFDRRVMGQTWKSGLFELIFKAPNSAENVRSKSERLAAAASFVKDLISTPYEGAGKRTIDRALDHIPALLPEGAATYARAADILEENGASVFDGQMIQDTDPDSPHYGKDPGFHDAMAIDNRPDPSQVREIRIGAEIGLHFGEILRQFRRDKELPPEQRVSLEMIGRWNANNASKPKAIAPLLASSATLTWNNLTDLVINKNSGLEILAKSKFNFARQIAQEIRSSKLALRFNRGDADGLSGEYDQFGQVAHIFTKKMRTMDDLVGVMAHEGVHHLQNGGDTSIEYSLGHELDAFMAADLVSENPLFNGIGQIVNFLAQAYAANGSAPLFSNKSWMSVTPIADYARKFNSTQEEIDLFHHFTTQYIPDGAMEPQSSYRWPASKVPVQKDELTLALERMNAGLTKTAAALEKARIAVADPNFKKYTSADSDVSGFEAKFAVSSIKASEFFMKMASNTRLRWDYVQDYCFARAEVMAHEMKLMGTLPGKAWLFADTKGDQQLQPQALENFNPEMTWKYHVAPTIPVLFGNGARRMVVDPSVAKGVLTPEEWFGLMRSPGEMKLARYGEAPMHPRRVPTSGGYWLGRAPELRPGQTLLSYSWSLLDSLPGYKR